MTYSRSRLLTFGVLWLVAGVVLFAGQGLPTAEAQGTNCGATPCMFPAEAHVGGIVLGVSQLSGQSATTFKVDGTGIATPLPPGRVDPVDQTIALGLNNLQANNFFLYKSWKYDDSQQQNADVYMWITANRALLEAEGGNDGCGDQNTDGVDGENCDLLAYSGEVSSGYFDAQATVLGVDVSATASEFWVDDPEDDQCGAIQFFPPGINVCLELIEDGALASGDIGSTDIELLNFMTRVHYAKAVRSNGLNKILSLDDAYLEIRHGKGEDRSRVLQGDTSQSTQRGNQWQDPINQYGGDNPTERNGVSQGFICSGGPDGDTVCDPQDDPNDGFNSGDDGDRVGGDENGGSYDDIHDGSDNTAP